MEHKYKQYGLALSLLLFIPSLSFADDWQQAREYIQAEKIGEAVALYAQLSAAQPDKAIIQMEYAYALALAGLPENALMCLDQANRLGADKTSLSFYVAQVFSLIGRSDMAAPFWKPANSMPLQWFPSNYVSLLGRYELAQSINHDVPDSVFVRANSLAIKGMYFKSLVLFRELEQSFPDNYVPYVGSSLVWEKIGKREIAALKLDTAIRLMYKTMEQDSLSTEDAEALTNAMHAFNRHLMKLQSKNPLDAPHIESPSNPQYMAYASGSLSSAITSLTVGGGWFFSETSNLSANLGISGSGGSTFLSLGATIYERLNSWVSGYGFTLQSSEGGTTLNYSGSIGYSIFNNAKSRSTDIFLIYGFPVAPWNLKQFMVGISIGQSLYFGKRKKQ